MTHATDPKTCIAFWTEEVGEDGWYRSDPALDARIRELWLPVWEDVHRGGEIPWPLDTPQGTLAASILLDQYPRNMFRGEARAFATDARARDVVRAGIAAGHHEATPEPVCQFYFLPFEHSESLADQDEGVRLIEARMGKGEIWLHANAHHEVIRRFGRFPFRNEALGRLTTPEEQAFLDAGAYGAVVREMRATLGLPGEAG